MREPARWVAHVAAVLQPPLVEAAHGGCGLAMGVKAHPRIARGCDVADARSERFEAAHTRGWDGHHFRRAGVAGRATQSAMSVRGAELRTCRSRPR